VAKLNITSYKTGDEIEAKCLPACGKNLCLAHTIVAMVGDKIAKVKCNTCQKEHSYRPPDSPSEATAAKRRAERKKAQLEATPRMATPEDYAKLIKQVDVSTATKYSMKMDLDIHTVIDHPKFGVGVVTDLREGSKASIAFPDGGRVLVYGRA
jgi:ribosomal protein L44E